MKWIFWLSFGFLLLQPFSPLLHAGGEGGGEGGTVVILPDESGLSVAEMRQDEEFFRFEGALRLEGILLAYWDASYRETGPVTLEEASPERRMYLRFYPDPASLERLPAFASPSGRVSRPTRVFLYRAIGKEQDGLQALEAGYLPHEAEAIESVTGDFLEMPPEFLEHYEGYALQPVAIELEGWISFFEGNHRFVYARARDIEPLSLTDYALRQIPDSRTDVFLGRPWAETFYVEQAVILREEPDAGSPEVAHLEAGTAGIEKVRTAESGWVLVQIGQGESQDTVSGYVKASQLIVIN
ncbi:MAG: hypothetical protein JJU06_04715 [Ectothiorhodospiraceae bacterium]|nr:hypothetical protein [Ectothiorhodospiraceae bacterium]